MTLMRRSPLKRKGLTRKVSPRTKRNASESRRGNVQRHRRVKRKWARDIPEKIRQQVYARDRSCCRECGRFLVSGERHAHHVRTRGAGGGHYVSNLITLCAACHDRVHADPDMMAKWQRWAEESYGPDYWRVECHREAESA